VEGTPFDFRAGRAIGEAINDSDPRLISAHGYDLNFPVPGEGLRPAAELTGDISGIRLTVMTDLPAVQLYTGNFLSGEKGKGGAVYPRHSGVCLETQRFPNARNEPRFPSMILRAGETLSSRTVWALSRAE
jgi:aldose 1-epimerase